MSKAKRLALYRQVLADLAARKVAPRKRDDVQLDPDVLADAFAAALSRFTTEDGSLRVWNESGNSPKGGS